MPPLEFPEVNVEATVSSSDGAALRCCFRGDLGGGGGGGGIAFSVC